MNYFITFVAFVLFLLSQYAIWVCSNLVAHWFNATGQTYWCIVLVAFLMLNEFCFGAYSFNFDDDEDFDEYDWVD